MFTVKPIGIVHNDRKTVEDDFWSEVVSIIELDGELEDSCLEGLDTFSHVEVMYVFHLVPDNKIEYGSRHPRNNQNWPKVGIFAQRGKSRPNKIGSTIVKILKVQNKKIYVIGLDAIDKTPVIDLKPVMKEFLPNEEIKQPNWSLELMENYWK